MSSTVTLRILPESEEVAKFYNPSGQAGAIKGDSGLDLYTWKVTKVGERQFKIDFGVRCEMKVTQNELVDAVEDIKSFIRRMFDKESQYYREIYKYKAITTYEHLSYMLVPRSSIVKTPYRMSNSIGIIDSGYRGNIMAFVDVLGDGPVVEPKVGERLFQIVRPTLERFDYEIVNELSQTERGTGGFGSTGV
jgi:arsenate reductase-like glutaredoxin family protein